MQHKLKSACESILLQVGVFFRRQKWKEIGIFIFFLLLSFIFWFMQALQQDYEQRIVFPLRYKNVPVEWVLSDNNPNAISVLIKEKGTNLLYFFWKPRFRSVDISIPSLPKLSDSTLQISSRLLESELSRQLMASTSIISFQPREIELLYDTLSSRLIPVSVQLSVAMRQGFQLSDNITVTPAEALLFGSSRILETLQEVQTKHKALDDLAKTTEVKVQLALPPGVKVESDNVKITIPVEEFTEKIFQLPVQCLDIPESYVLRIFPSSVEITCNVPLSQFRELTDDKLEISIPFAHFEEHQATGKIPVKVTRQPAYVTNLAVVPNELEFIIEHHD